MGFFDSLLWPIKVAVAWIMVRAHDVLTWLGMDPAGGWTWLLSIVALVVVIRILLIPLFVRQIKASRGMQLVQPEIQKLQKKYKGKTDPASRQAQQQEMMAIYKEAGTSPFASCLPILAQMPIFFALFRVLASLEAVATGTYARESIGPLTQDLAAQAESSEIFGASLSSTFLGSDDLAVKFVTAALIIIMSATTLFTQRQLTMKNMPQSALDNPMARQQRMLMYILPLVFAFSGVNFPIGVLVYWSTSNLWSMGQQWFVIRNSPAPGSEAEKAYKDRQARKAKRRGKTLEDDGSAGPGEAGTDTLTIGTSGQRQQPKRNSPRSKRAGTRPAAVSAGGAVEQESESESIAEPAPSPSSKSTKPKK
ncbi:membrane protein insertase YidC [Occultella aeris]|uniref:Membrane protein insertase YidC n=1 Tax=Occultella aeris TaxID=2761496 RepID=A0A7M4DD34_9MICO|nr:membrane protein insertase YidC [Occultella aeris]VZO34742.1 Membrane protein insertase MisCA precursor [Occultella aeris]